MSRIVALTATMLAFATVVGAQDAQPPQEASQTPREALIEMMSANDVQVFKRHLLNETQEKLQELNSYVQQRVSSSGAFAGSILNTNQNSRWFPNGPMLYFASDPKTKARIEVMVDKENLQGDIDDMELSIHTINPDQPSKLVIVPYVLVRMQSEASVWKLSAIGVSISVPLDGALVDNIAEKLKSSAPVPVTSSASTVPNTDPALPREVSFNRLSNVERNAVNDLHTLVNAEIRYRSAYQQIGYTCVLSDLGGQGNPQAEPGHAMLIGPDLENGAKDEYRFMLTDCSTTPASTFKVIAVPIGSARHGRKAFCADQTGTVHFSDDGRGVTCLSERNLLKSADLQPGN